MSADGMPRNVRTPPWSLDSEQAVIGGLMLDANALDRIAERICEEDFYRKDHRMIFRAITELSARGRPCDAVTMAEWFDANKLTHLIDGGVMYVIELANQTPSAANIAAYAEIVREKSVLRQVIDLAGNLGNDGFSPDGRNPMQIVDDAIASLMAMQKQSTQSEFTLRQAMTEAYKAAKLAKDRGGIPGIHTGLTQLDRVLGGWHNSDLTVIGARPSMGKTALMLNCSLAANVPAGIISAEQPMKQIGARMMSIQSHVPAERMRSGRFETDDLARLEAGARSLTQRTCLIYDRSSPTIAEVTRTARKWKKQDGIKILFVDYIQRLEAVTNDPRAKKSERVGEVVKGLKNLARDLDIPVIALSQVGRHVDTRPDKQPGMADMSDSSEIEKEADQVLTMYRPFVYDDKEPEALAIISVEKNRHGPIGTVKCAWLAETMRFEDMARG